MTRQSKAELKCAETSRKSGRSSKPRRKHRAPDIGSLIEAAFAERIDVVENGEIRRMTVLAAIFEQLWVQEMKGDRQALKVRIKYEAFARKLRPIELPRIFVEGGLPQEADGRANDNR